MFLLLLFCLDLDFFQFNPEIPQNPKSNESHIYVTLKPENLPGDDYGNLTIVCTRVDRVDRVVGICEHNEYCECYCKNLIAGTEYSIELLNSKQGFNSTSTKLSNIFTRNVRIFLYIKDNGLIGKQS